MGHTPEFTLENATSLYENMKTGNESKKLKEELTRISKAEDGLGKLQRKVKHHLTPYVEEDCKDFWDDTEKLIKERLRVYNEQTSPLIDFYKGKGNYGGVDGEKKISDILVDILELLKSKGL